MLKKIKIELNSLRVATLACIVIITFVSMYLTNFEFGTQSKDYFLALLICMAIWYGYCFGKDNLN